MSRLRAGLRSRTTLEPVESVRSLRCAICACVNVTPSVLRLGKPLEHLQAALKAASVISRPGEQITTVLRQLCYTGFIGYDHVVWVS